MIILLDASPLGLLASSKASPGSRECNAWLRQLLDARYLVVVPEIADYEVRRELLRSRMSRGLLNLDALGRRLTFAPINTPVMRLAAEYWATARQCGMPTAGDRALDADMNLVAQASLLEEAWQQDVVIATTNVRHLARFAKARHWREIG